MTVAIGASGNRSATPWRAFQLCTWARHQSRRDERSAQPTTHRWQSRSPTAGSVLTPQASHPLLLSKPRSRQRASSTTGRQQAAQRLRAIDDRHKTHRHVTK